MVSRINHPHSETKKLLSKLIAGVLAEHPKQSLWLFAATIKSKDKDRAACGKETLDKIRVSLLQDLIEFRHH
jgi:serine/threonine-protein kinase ATR